VSRHRNRRLDHARHRTTWMHRGLTGDEQREEVVAQLRGGHLLARGPGRYCSSTPRQMMLFNSRHEGYKCVSMTWRAISGRPYLACGDQVAQHRGVGTAGVASRHVMNHILNPRFLS